MGSLFFFSPGSLCTQDIVCALQESSLCFAQSCNQTPLTFKPRFSGDSSFDYQTPRLENLTWASKHSLLWDNFCGIIAFQFVGSPRSSMGFEFIMIAPLLPSRCGFLFVFGCRVSFFGRFQCFFVNGCSAVTCDFGVFIRSE